MKVIIRRDKRTKKIIGDFGEYEILNKEGKTEADIYARVEAFNKKFHEATAEIVELDEVAEFYRTRTLNAYKENLKDFEFMADKLDNLSRMIEDYIDEAKKAYKEKQE